MLRKVIVAAAAVATLAFVAGCGDDEPAHETHTAANGDIFNDADVAFATDMIPHHAQALAMVDLTIGRTLDPPVQELADDIRAAQTPEIETMSRWLMDWDEPIPPTMRDHAHADDHSGMDRDSDTDMPGMMSSEEMSDLEHARGEEFQDRWLEMMIEHHEGAVEMARTEQDDGTFRPAVELAESIERSQQAEIDTMQKVLDS